MEKQPLRIAKTLHHVDMWVHPSGLVKGSIYVTVGKNEVQENPQAVLNQEKAFLVLKRSNPEELRFYNRSSIIRVEYDDEKPTSPTMTILRCSVTMMDGSEFNGEIIEVLPPEHSRLYDYLNQGSNRFIRLFLSEHQACMLNKSYITQVNAI